MASPLRARARRALAAGIGTAALATLVPLGLAQPAAAASAPICTSYSHPALAAKLSHDIASAVSGRYDRYALNVWDAKTGVYCAINAYATFDSASVVKATIMGAVLRRAQEQHRYLTSWEISNLRPMIENSDNTAASNLWYSLGRTRLDNFLRLVGMNYTTLGPGGYWGLTQITARDEMRLLDVYTDRTDVLTPNSKAYGLNLMAHVESDQRWGTPYGTPAGVLAHNKNGWLQRSFGDWRVHSIGVFTGNGKNYRMTVLTDHESSMGYGVTTIERIAWAVNRDLGTYNGTAAATTAPRLAGPQPGADTPLNPTSDGSVPLGVKG